MAAQDAREQLEAEALGLPVTFKSIDPHGTPEQIRKRYDEAWVFIKRGFHDVGLRELKWLYAATNGPDADYWQAPLREQIIESLARLAAHHPATQAFIRSELDRLEAMFRRGHLQPREWRAWAELGRAAGEDDRIVAFYEERRSPDGSLTFAAIHPYARDEVFEILLERRRYADAGRFLGDLVRGARQALEFTDEFFAEYGDRCSEEFVASEHQEDREELALHYALGLAAGKDDDAAGVAATLLNRHDDLASRRALVEAAARIGVDSPELHEWAAALASADAASVTSAQTAPAVEPPESSGATAPVDDAGPSDDADGDAP